MNVVKELPRSVNIEEQNDDELTDDPSREYEIQSSDFIGNVAFAKGAKKMNASTHEIEGLVPRTPYHFLVILGLIFGSLLGITGRAIISTVLPTPTVNVNDTNFHAATKFVMSTAGDKFKSQDAMFKFSIISGLEQLSEGSNAVYLFLLDKESKSSAMCIVEMISIATTKLWPDTRKWLFINGNQLSHTKQTDPGFLIEKLKESLDHSKLVIVSDLDKIPAKLAQGFHSLVDRYNPVTKKALFVFTVVTSVPRENTSPIEIVEEHLNTSWVDLDLNLRSPLITRVTDAVIRIMPESETGECQVDQNSANDITRFFL